MSKKQELIEKLCAYGNGINENSGFDEAVKRHYDLMAKIYEKNSLFYKTIIRESRIYIVIAILCFFYSRGKTSQAEVREYCKSMKFASGNSIDSQFFFLRVSGRLEAVRNSENKRILMISPTEKLLAEEREYITSALLPLNVLFPALQLPPDFMSDEANVVAMHRNMYELLINRVIISQVVPEVHLFTEKDSGHMIFISLYLEALTYKRRNNNQPGIFEYPYNTVSKTLAVSRTHVRRIVNAAAKAGWMTVHDNSRIEVTAAFMKLLRNYMALYFALGVYCLELEPGNIRPWAEP
ncbi:hypothetical protein [Enterobacillus tribolii]|uniref:Uncharacterized protein n=1 Tax=Enterobacillus tribolii TaxID=1487935 RepID=A0A370R1J5_9GAMM|nr:hypothetical protein [Enterobacillus tribolii]MBW7983105.1 hypothetical protein [Enterobacillus tribolii]RDK95791.1 hypothetical protein C8D90_102274 [Enterobacillus tribolii]